MTKRLTLFTAFIFLIIAILSACGRIEVGIEPDATAAPSSETPSPLPTTSAAATPSPAPSVTPLPQIDLTYVNPTYGFKFIYPGDWSLREMPASIELSSDDGTLLINFQPANENRNIAIAIPATGTLEDRGSTSFLTQLLSKAVLIQDGSVKAVYYNNGQPVQAGELAFSFALSIDNSVEGLTEPTILEADAVINSFEHSFNVETPPCLNKMTFEADVTIPDDTRFSPGDKFVKSWKILNSGTCTWTTDYSLVFESGDQMSAISPQKLTSPVLPGESVVLSVELIAPASNGIYRGNWLLQDENGKRFGYGINADKPFWVQITVGETAADFVSTLGNPVIRDFLNNADYWFLPDTPSIRFSLGNGNLILQDLTTGSMDEWGISRYPKQSDFYLEYKFTTGDTCSGLDRYGMIARAPESNQGYVFSFSCDGRYRLYIWNGVKYQPIQEWKYSPLINPGANQVNRMGFYAKGETLRLYANGQLLAEYEDATYAEGQFGVLIGAQETTGFIVYLEEIAYWKFSDH